MHFNFSFNLAKYDLWEIYRVIQKYYPIGIMRVEDGIYFEYPGIKEYVKILVENIHDSKNF